MINLDTLRTLSQIAEQQGLSVARDGFIMYDRARCKKDTTDEEIVCITAELIRQLEHKHCGALLQALGI